MYESDGVDRPKSIKKVKEHIVDSERDLNIRDICRIYWTVFITSMINKWMKVHGIRMDDLYCRIHNKIVVEHINDYFKDKREDESRDDYIKKNGSDYLKSLARNAFVMVNLTDSPLLNSIKCIKSGGELSFHEDLFEEYHSLENNCMIGDENGRNYTISKYRSLYNEMRKSDSCDFGIVILSHIAIGSKRVDPLIFDGHHRCALLYKMYGRDHVIYPKKWMVQVVIDDGIDEDVGEILDRMDINAIGDGIPLLFYFD